MPFIVLLFVLASLSDLAHATAKQDLVLAIGGEPNSGFDPINGWGGYGNPLFQSTLLMRDVNLLTQSDLATEWILSGDKKVWTVKIRDGVRFSNGTDLTAKDIAFTFNTAKKAANGIDLSVMEQTEALDNYTVRFKLTEPQITFVEAFYTLGIVPEADYGPNYGRNPVGSGPYKMLDWTEGEQLIVERNEYYYGKTAPFNQLTFLFTGEGPGLLASHAHKVDMVAVPAQLADNIPTDFKAVTARTVDNRGLSLPFTPPQSIEGRNVGNSVTSDKAIRRAINIGLDRALIVDVALHGHGTAAFGPADGLPWGGKNEGAEFNLSEALDILDKSGWVKGADGIRVKDGVRAAFPVNYPASDTTRQALAEITAELLLALGIEAIAKGGNWDSIERVMHTEPVIFGFGSHSPYQLYSLFSSDLAGIEYMNPSYYSNSSVDELFTKAQSASSLESSLPYWSEAADYYGVNADNTWAWLVNLDHVYFVHQCLDIGKTQIEPHGHGWPITSTIANWRWICE